MLGINSSFINLKRHHCYGGLTVRHLLALADVLCFPLDSGVVMVILSILGFMLSVAMIALIVVFWENR